MILLQKIGISIRNLFFKVCIVVLLILVLALEFIFPLVAVEWEYFLCTVFLLALVLRLHIITVSISALLGVLA